MTQFLRNLEPDMATCLFTGEMLDSSTREEHTIPRSLAGRIRSRVVSSTEFNNRCGQYLDDTLKSPFALMLNILAPVLSAEHQPGLLPVDVPGERSALFLEQGSVTRRGMKVVGVDALTGRPNAAVAANEMPLRKLAKQQGKEANLKLSTVRATQESTFFSSGPQIFADIEVAALKSSLLTFDHLLHEEPERFTRLSSLDGVREFVRQAVMDRQLNGNACHRYSLGQQYDRVPMYQELRKLIPHEQTPFEHTMLVAGNAACRCIDIVWIVLDFDPFGFRVCWDWSGCDFAYGVVNGVLKGTSCSGLIPLLPPDELLCRPTKMRAFPELPFPEEERSQAMEFVGNRRMEAYREAVYYVEMHADESVISRLIEASACDPESDRGAELQIRRKLKRLYGQSANTKSFDESLANIFRRHTHSLASETLSQAISPDPSNLSCDWVVWLNVYRNCLDDLKNTVGLPGDIFSNRVELRTLPEERLVGEHPNIE